MTQTERISHMEKCLDDSRVAIDRLSQALEAYKNVQGKIRELEEYYSGEWRNDFEDDEAGKLPPDLKRGVLSEDALYDLLSDDHDLKAEILDVFAGNH